MTILGIILGLAFILAAYAIKIYNSLVTKRVYVNESWSDITVQLKRRYDLIPNLVDTVKGYASHEKSTLENVIAARNSAASKHGDAAEQSGSENILSGALKQLFALSESYPDLKANENFANLQNELSDIEEVVQKARRYYNGCVREMNEAVQTFPSNLVAGQFGFTKANYFELDESENEAVKEAPKVSF